MKTSNKLLFGLFFVLLVGLVVLNLVLHRKSKQNITPSAISISHIDSTVIVQDSMLIDVK